jgi:Na+-translocating ferredoxin:NAD+ oxidoreductase RnfE subunit
MAAFLFNIWNAQGIYLRLITTIFLVIHKGDYFK